MYRYLLYNKHKQKKKTAIKSLNVYKMYMYHKLRIYTVSQLIKKCDT